MRRLLVYQAIWGMENLPGVDLEAGLEAAMDQIADAGFDGVGVSLMRAERAEAVARAVHARGQSFEAIGFIRNRSDLARWIDYAQQLGAHHLNVQIMERPDRVADAAALMTDLEKEAARSSIPVYYETHRGRLTNDLLFVCRLLDEMPDLELTGDLSHYPLVHEMPLPVPQSDLARMSKVIAHCQAFHGRVCGSHQVQVSIAAPQHQAWVEQFRAWWREGFADWMARSSPNGELTFMAELGPPHYAITDAEGRELCDRWAEAVMLKEMAREIWRDVAGQA
jgi:hypothetical protein